MVRTHRRKVLHIGIQLKKVGVSNIQNYWHAFKLNYISYQRKGKNRLNMKLLKIKWVYLKVIRYVVQIYLISFRLLIRTIKGS